MTHCSSAFSRQVAAYTNTAAHNDRLFAECAAATAAHPLLARHRAHVERHQLGYGDPAFHAMWLNLLEAAHLRFGHVEALEIGVFKGQVISLWALLARHHAWDLRIHAVSPLAGKPMPPQGLWRSLRYRLSSHFREQVAVGNFHPEENYAELLHAHFAAHDLSFDAVRLVRGYSTDPAVLAALAQDRFHLVYIDGDHTYAGALADIENFAPKVVPGGWLVMDDAAYHHPGTTFWKGFEPVARATLRLPELGFVNVINIGHNCVFQRGE